MLLFVGEVIDLLDVKQNDVEVKGDSAKPASPYLATTHVILPRICSMISRKMKKVVLVVFDAVK